MSPRYDCMSAVRAAYGSILAVVSSSNTSAGAGCRGMRDGDLELVPLC